MITLRQQLNEILSKTPIVLGRGNSIIHVSEKEFTHAKYLCTEEEKDFQLINGKVFFKGFQLIHKRW